MSMSQNVKDRVNRSHVQGMNTFAQYLCDPVLHFASSTSLTATSHDNIDLMDYISQQGWSILSPEFWVAHILLNPTLIWLAAELIVEVTDGWGIEMFPWRPQKLDHRHGDSIAKTELLSWYKDLFFCPLEKTIRWFKMSIYITNLLILFIQKGNKWQIFETICCLH